MKAGEGSFSGSFCSVSQQSDMTGDRAEGQVSFAARSLLAGFPSFPHEISRAVDPVLVRGNRKKPVFGTAAIAKPGSTSSGTSTNGVAGAVTPAAS